MSLAVKSDEPLAQRTAATMTMMGESRLTVAARELISLPCMAHGEGNHTETCDPGEYSSKLPRHVQLEPPKAVDSLGHVFAQSHHLYSLDLPEHRGRNRDPGLDCLVPGTLGGNGGLGDFL